jgi:hypothetical protein
MTSSTFLPKKLSQKQRSPVERRAFNWVSGLGVKELPLEVAKDRFSEDTGFYDRITLKNYFGVQKFYGDAIHFEQDIEYTRTGTTVHKRIRRRQKLTQKKGYLEKMSLVSFELRGSTWFMIVNKDAVLIPQLVKTSYEPMKNISLTPIQGNPLRKECEKTFGCLTKELVNKQQPSREIYKLVDKSVYNELTPLEKAKLRAKPKEAS